MISVSTHENKVEKFCLNRFSILPYIFQIITAIVLAFAFTIMRSQTGNDDKASHYEFDSFCFFN